MKPTFKQQFDKLTTAYIRGKINPYARCACFVGNLLDGGDWDLAADINYSFSEIKKLEEVFMVTTKKLTIGNSGGDDYYLQGNNTFLRERVRKHPNYENALFTAFEKTLDLLKQIHESKGEIVEPVQFVKRELKNNQYASRN